MNLVPFVSIHLKVKDHLVVDCTVDKVYLIEEWTINKHGTVFYRITDDVGDIRKWIWREDESSVEDVTFERNLQKILE